VNIDKLIKSKLWQVMYPLLSLVGGMVVLILITSRFWPNERNADDDNGGWLLDPNPGEIDTDICNIDRLHVRDIQPELFEAK
jgi:hypothetical protein